MVKKYDITNQQAENIFSELMKTRFEDIEEDIGKGEDEEDPFYIDNAVSTFMLEALTGYKSYEEVKENEIEAESVNRGISSMYGFNTLAELYLYAESCEGIVMKGKDYGNLVPVKMTVTRGGKEQEITVYRKPGEGNKEEDKKVSDSGVKGSRKHAKQLASKLLDKDEKADPQFLADVKRMVQELGKTFDEHVDVIIVIGDESVPSGVAGFNIEDKYLVFQTAITFDDTHGIKTRSFFEGLSYAKLKNLGFQIQDEEKARPLFQQFGLEQEGDDWRMEASEVQQLFGENDDS